MQAPGCTSPGKDHADSTLVVLMEDRKHAFGGMWDVWREGNGSSSCHSQGAGLPALPLQDLLGSGAQSLLDCLLCQGWGLALNCSFSSQGWQELELIESC